MLSSGMTGCVRCGANMLGLRNRGRGCYARGTHHRRKGLGCGPALQVRQEAVEQAAAEEMGLLFEAWSDATRSGSSMAARCRPRPTCDLRDGRRSASLPRRAPQPLQATAIPVKTADEGVNLAWNILSNVTIPIGAVRDVAPDGTVHYDYTQWANVSDLTNRRFHFRTYGNQNLRAVSPADLPADGKEIIVIAMETQPQYRNVSADARVGLG